MARSVRRYEPLEYVVGTDDTLNLGLFDDSNAALDVTGATATWKPFEAVPRRRRKPFKGTALLTKTSPAG